MRALFYILSLCVSLLAFFNLFYIIQNAYAHVCMIHFIHHVNTMLLDI